MQIHLRQGVDPNDFWEEYGLLVSLINEKDSRPAREQFDRNYQHGGGWRPFGGEMWTVLKNADLIYPGDPPYQAIAVIRHHEERIFIYEHGIVRVEQPDGSFEVARLD